MKIIFSVKGTDIPLTGGEVCARARVEKALPGKICYVQSLGHAAEGIILVSGLSELDDEDAAKIRQDLGVCVVGVSDSFVRRSPEAGT